MRLPCEALPRRRARGRACRGTRCTWAAPSRCPRSGRRSSCGRASRRPRRRDQCRVPVCDAPLRASRTSCRRRELRRDRCAAPRVSSCNRADEREARRRLACLPAATDPSSAMTVQRRHRCPVVLPHAAGRCWSHAHHPPHGSALRRVLLIEGDVELQHVDPRLADEAEHAAVLVGQHQFTHLIRDSPRGPWPPGSPADRRRPARCVDPIHYRWL